MSNKGEPSENLTKKKRTRSPAYPSVSLKRAIEMVTTLWASLGKHPGHVDSAIASLGFQRATGAAMRVVAALQHYGLIEDSGSGKDRRVAISERAQDIVLLPDSDDRKHEAVLKAAFSPKIYLDLWERYGKSLPDDEVISAYLVRDREFNPTAVDGLLKDYRTTIEFANPDIGMVIGDSEVNDDSEENTKVQEDKGSPQVDSVTPPPPLPKKQPAQMNPETQYFSIPTDAGEAMIPMGMSAGDFDLFQKALDLFRVKIVAAPDGPASESE